MEIKAYYKKIIQKRKLNFEFEKTKNKRPAWIRVEGLPKGTNFIKVDLGKRGIKGQRIQFYKTYLPDGLFLPIDYVSEEMKKFYDKFSEIYDKKTEEGGVGVRGQNLLATKFLLSKVKKYLEKGEMLDLGAGTGIMTEIFVKKNYFPGTLVDYSIGMLDKAKKRKTLKGCDFVCGDFRNLNLKKKFDLVISTFSFGGTAYFSDSDFKKIFSVVKKHLKKRGIFALIGHLPLKEIKKNFKEVDSGLYDLSRRNKFYTDYFIGRLKNGNL